MNPYPIKLLLVDDHVLFNDGLCALLAYRSEVIVVNQVYDSRKTPFAVLLHRPDVVLMDYSMPGMNGIEMTRELLRANPRQKIIILSAFGKWRSTEEAVEAGAKGCLSKSVSLDEIIRAVDIVYAGKTCFAQQRPETTGPVNNQTDHYTQKFNLTYREIDVIQQIRQGLSSRQIAEQLGVSHYTVETHRRNIHLKLNLKGQAELVRFIADNHF
jgi:DNA-binding NarL/FixJ family response regulator